MDDHTTACRGDDGRALGEALCRSLLYEALSIAFQPPAGETIGGLRPGAHARRMCDTAAILDDLCRDDVPSGALEGPAARTAALPAAALSPEVLAASYLRLFGHTARSRVPAYESEYGDDGLFQKPHELGDIAGFLRAFGLKADPTRHERLDHVACELEFMSFLARKEAWATEAHDRTMIEETRKGQRLFLQDHLGRFAPSFTARVRGEDPAGFYGAVAGLTRALVESDCRRFGVEPGPEALRLSLPLDDAVPAACGTGSCAPADCDGGSGAP